MSSSCSASSISAPPPSASVPRPADASVPPRCTVPGFPPVLAGAGRGSPRLRRALRPPRRLLAAGLAVAAAGAMVTAARTAPPGDPPGPGARGAPPADRQAASAPGRDDRPARETVSAPVRIADAAAVGLLQPGDRVDVIATGAPDAERVSSRGDGSARVVARNVPVVQVPEGETGALPHGGASGGALVVLGVSRHTATELAGAAASSALTVTLC